MTINETPPPPYTSVELPTPYPNADEIESNDFSYDADLSYRS
jgi:hypothetical protein